MELRVRKIKLVNEILKLENEKILGKLEKLLRLENKNQSPREFSYMCLEELNALIDNAENDVENGRIYEANEMLKIIERWH